MFSLLPCGARKQEMCFKLFCLTTCFKGHVTISHCHMHYEHVVTINMFCLVCVKFPPKNVWLIHSVRVFVIWDTLLLSMIMYQKFFVLCGIPILDTYLTHTLFLSALLCIIHQYLFDKLCFLFCSSKVVGEAMVALEDIITQSLCVHATIWPILPYSYRRKLKQARFG